MTKKFTIARAGGRLNGKNAASKTCIWTEQEDGWWEACDGNAFECFDGGLRENKVKFCPYCGRTIKTVPLPAEVHADPEPEEYPILKS